MEEKNIVNEQIENESQATEVETGETGEVTKDISLGKFKDVKSLLQAYNSLEAEFTKRCQHIKELEGEIKEKDKLTAPSTEILEERRDAEKKLSEQQEQEIIKNYLKGIISSKQSAVIMAEGGASVITPATKPRTISEAGELAKKLLTK